jgi:hypothetical protein
VDRGQADIVVADLARHLGLGALALNDDGMAVLALDDSIIVAVGYNQPAGSLDLMTCLDSVEPSPARRLAALKGNFGSKPGGQTVAVDPATGAFVLQRRYFGQDLVEEGLAGAVQDLVEQAGRLSRRLSALAGPDKPGEHGDPHGQPFGLRA